MTRRQARESALAILYELEFRPEAEPRDLAAREAVSAEAADAEFTGELVRAYISHRAEVDALVEEKADNWRLSRMPLVDRNIMRLGATEILYFSGIPRSVSIDECLEVAKKYGGEESRAFVNGVLDKIEKGESPA